jgi:spore coat protein SA
MKVAFVNQPMDMLIPPYQNSIGIWTYKVAPHVARRHDVTVYGKRSRQQKAWNGQERVHYQFMPPLVPNRAFMKRFGRFLPAFQDQKLPAFASRLFYLDYSSQIALKLKGQRADIVHVHNFTQFVPVIRALNPDAKIVLHMSCEWLNQLDYDVIDRRLEGTDLVLGSSDYITAKIRQRFPHHAQRCQTVFNGVDTEVFAGKNHRKRPKTGDPKRILFVGRVSPEKGLHDLLEAFLIVAGEWPEVQLDIAGPIDTLPREFIVGVSDDPAVSHLASFYDVDYGAYLRQMVPPHLAGQVNFLGGLPQAGLVEYYQAADVLVNPSYSESFGMSLVEAMACEKPVVATRVGGMVDIVEEGRTGYLVDRGEPQALAEAILRLLRDGALGDKMGKAGRQLVLERFSWSQVAESLMNNYEKLYE